MEALLPPGDSPEKRAAIDRMPGVAGELYELQYYDDPLLKGSLPTVLTALRWIPVLCFWLTWRPLPFDRQSIKSRQKLFHKLESSRLYALRGLFLTAKIFACMIFFHEKENWHFVGYDGKGQLEPEIIPSAYDDWRQP